MGENFWQNVLSSSVALLILFAIMGVVYLIWSQVGAKKKREYFKELHTELAPGQEIMFAGGIYGNLRFPCLGMIGIFGDINEDLFHS